MRLSLSKYTWPALFLLSACVATTSDAAEPGGKKKLPRYDIVNMDRDDRHFLTIESNFNIKGGDYRQGNSVGDVDCKRSSKFSALEVEPGSLKKRGLRFERQGSPSRALYEWHICFVIEGVTYRAWRGFDPGPGTDLEITCFIDKEQIARQDTSKYLCRTERVTQSIANHTEYAIHCWAAKKCKSFDTKEEFEKWTSLNPLSRDELLKIVAAILEDRLPKDRYVSIDHPVAYYLSVGGEDPPMEFLGRISSEKLRFLPGSDFGKEDKKNLSTLISIGRFEQIEKGVAKGSYSTYCGPLCASGHTVIVERVNRVWKVKSVRMDWIS